MHEQRRLQTANLAEVFFRVATMISDGGVDFVAAGSDKYHQRAKAISNQGNLSSRFLQLNSGADRFHDISCARIAIKRHVQSQAVLPIGF